MRVAANGLGTGAEVVRSASDCRRNVRSWVKEGLLEERDDDVMSRLAARSCGS